jgi:hypothetical protein
LPYKPCEVNLELAAVVNEALAELVRLTSAQLAAFQNREHAEVMRLDKILENAVGVKERAIGAYNEHRRSHGC